MNKKKKQNHSVKLKEDNTTFGMHLMLDAYGASKEKMNDMRLVFRFLNEAPSIIGMTKLTTPLVVEAYETKSAKDPGGFSGMVLINESHISIHTFPKRGFFTLDVYSCNDFQEQVDILMAYIKKTFDHKEEEIQVVKRGTRYPVRNYS